MLKKVLASIIILGFSFSGIFASQSASGDSSKIHYGWDSLDYGIPTIESSYFLGNGSKSDSGDFYQPINEVLPACSTLKAINKDEMDCIESLEARIGDSEWVKGSLTHYIKVRWQPRYIPSNLSASNSAEFSNDVLDIESDFDKNIFNGARSSLWNFPGITHTGGRDFLFYVNAYGIAINGKVDYKQGFLKSNLYAVEESNTGKDLDALGIAPGGFSLIPSGTCASLLSRMYCLKKHEYPADISFRVKLKLKYAAPSLNSERWFVSRSSETEILQSPISDMPGAERITITGKPVNVQVPELNLPREESILKSYLQKKLEILKKGQSNLSEMLEKAYASEIASAGLIDSSNNAGSTLILSIWDSFTAYQKITQVSGWSFNNIATSYSDPETSQIVGSCRKSKSIAGYYSSNSTVLEPGPPSYDKKNGSLNYRVASTHLTADGNRNLGVYSLFVSNDIAKCMWGSNLDGAKAEITIVSDNGEMQIATSVLNSNSKGLFLNVSGFHYSANTISLKLSPVKKSITCIKGKVIKKVTAVKPVCPNGFKAKK